MKREEASKPTSKEDRPSFSSLLASVCNLDLLLIDFISGICMCLQICSKTWWVSWFTPTLFTFPSRYVLFVHTGEYFWSSSGNWSSWWSFFLFSVNCSPRLSPINMPWCVDVKHFNISICNRRSGIVFFHYQESYIKYITGNSSALAKQEGKYIDYRLSVKLTWTLCSEYQVFPFENVYSSSMQHLLCIFCEEGRVVMLRFYWTGCFLSSALTITERWRSLSLPQLKCFPSPST